MSKDLSIPVDVFDLDPLRLDKHFLEQPKLVIEYAMKLADAKDSMDRSDAKLDLIKAEVRTKVESQPEKFGMSKTTVASIAAAVDKNKDVLEAIEIRQKRKHEVDILQAMMNALEHRKRALEGLVQLHGQQYFATPSVPSNFREEVQERTKRQARARRFARNG